MKIKTPVSLLAVSFMMSCKVDSIGRVLVVIAFILIAGCVSTFLPKQIKGIVYNKIKNSGETIHVATVDPKFAHLELLRAENPNLKTVTELSQGKNIHVAINAGFFTAEGFPVGATKINDKWIAYPAKSRGVFGWNRQGEIFFDRLSGAGRDVAKIKSELLGTPWWNRAENIVGGTPLIIFNGKILDVTSEQTLDSFLQNRYARTAICLDKNHHLKLFVVDGGDRNTAKFGLSGGMSIAELAMFLLTQGCVHALNLDGGYSSSFVYEGERKNKFIVSSLAERPVSTVLLVRFP